MGARTTTNIYETFSLEYEKTEKYGYSLYQHWGKDGGCALNAAIFLNEGKFFKSELTQQQKEFLVDFALGDIQENADMQGVDTFVCINHKFENGTYIASGYAAVVSDINNGYLDRDKCEQALNGEGEYAKYVAVEQQFSEYSNEIYKSVKLVMPLEVYFREATRDEYDDMRQMGLNIIKKMKDYFDIKDFTPEQLGAICESRNSIYDACRWHNVGESRLDEREESLNRLSQKEDSFISEIKMRQDELYSANSKLDSLYNLQWAALGQYGTMSWLDDISDDKADNNALYRKVDVAKYCEKNKIPLSIQMARFLPAPQQAQTEQTTKHFKH